MNLSDIDFNDPATKLLIKRKCEKSLLFFTRYFFRMHKGLQFKVMPFIKQVADALEKTARGEINRLIINLPPRIGKTEIAVINYMAWVLANNPKAKFIHLSYSQDLALNNSNKARELVSSVEYKSLWNFNLSEVENAKGNWATDKGGVVYATGSAGQVTGFGAGDIDASLFSGAVIIDDPLKADDANSDIERAKVNERFFSTIITRLNNVKVPVIIIMQRLHEDDLSGHLLAREPEKWVHIKIPAIIDNQSIWEDKYPLETLREMEKVNPRVFAGQMMQEPAPLEGNLFKDYWLQWYDGINRFTEIYQSWDTAIKDKQENDFSVCTTWGVSSNQFYLLDYFTDKLEAPLLKSAMITQAQKWKPRQIIIEDKASGQSLLQILRRETQLPIVAYEPKGDKVSRFAKATIQMEAGRVYFPKSKTWLDEIILQLKTFPNAKHDDIVDSISQMINWYNSKSQIDVFTF